MSEEPRTSSIDETPISPVREPSHVRQNSLEKHLQHRPDPKELRERHILLDNNAAPYVPIPSLGASEEKEEDVEYGKADGDVGHFKQQLTSWSVKK